MSDRKIEATLDWEQVALSWKKNEKKLLLPRHELNKRMICLTQPIKTHRLLDFGTGVGEPGLTAAKIAGCEVYGVDVSDTMLKMAEERRNSMGITNFQLFLLDRPVLPFKNNFFDAVLSSFAIEYSTHLDEDVKELHRVLKPGGLFVISLWQDCEERNPFQALIPKTIREVSYETSLSHDIFFKFSKDDFLEKKMLSLGFTQINHEIFEGHFSYDSVDEFWNLKKMASPAVMKDMGLLTARQGLEVQEKIEKFFVCNKSDSQKEYELPFSAHIYVYKKDFL